MKFNRIAVLLLLSLTGSNLAMSEDVASPPPSRTGQRNVWAGLPPDCWTRARNYQTEGDDWDWPSRTKIERVAATRPATVTLSPNGAYYFSLEQSPRQAIIVFAEKVHLVRISFTDAKGMTDARWINEKLLYLRVWWGRVSATDFVFDVEKERVMLTESTHDGAIAMEQSRDSCPRLGGCQCIPKAPQ